MSAPELHACEQRSAEWHALRAGIPTASEFATVMAKGRGGAPSKTRTTYMLKLAGERITGEPAENHVNAAMERGILMEAEALAAYAFQSDAEIASVGFVRLANEKGRAGCSPDGLIGADGLVEIKTAAPHVLIPLLRAGTMPPAHVPQVQGQLWVTERQWCDLVVYWPKMPMLTVRVERDEDYIAGLAEGVARFNADLDALVDRVRARGAPPPPAAGSHPGGGG